MNIDQGIEPVRVRRAKTSYLTKYFDRLNINDSFLYTDELDNVLPYSQKAMNSLSAFIFYWNKCNKPKRIVQRKTENNQIRIFRIK